MTRQKGWYWTPERVVAAIQVFHEIYGRRPGWDDFNPGKNEPEKLATFKRDGCWPSGATVIRHWGSWNYAMAAAGYEPIKRGGGVKPYKNREKCDRGHEYTEANTRIRTHADGRQTRVCRKCVTIDRRASYDRNHKGAGSRKSRGMPPSDHPKWKEKV